MGTVATVSIAGNTYSVYGLTSNPVADADAHFGAQLGADNWAAAPTDTKRKALVTAARWLDRLAWKGTPSVGGQPLAWPRDDADCNGTPIANGTVPDAIARGEFELALLLLGDSSLVENASTGSNVKRVKAGSVELENFAPTLGRSTDAPLPTVPFQLVRCMLAGAGSAALVSADAFGVTDGSAFSPDDFGLNGANP